MMDGLSYSGYLGGNIESGIVKKSMILRHSLLPAGIGVVVLNQIKRKKR